MVAGDRARVQEGEAARRSGRCCSCSSPPKNRACSARSTTRTSRCIRSTKTRRQHQHRRHQPVGPHEGPHASSASARRISTTTRATPPPSRAACSRPTPNRRRASTTARITSTSRRRACRRSIPTPASTSSASPRATASRSATSTRATDYHAPSDEVKPDWDLTGAAEDGKLFLAMGYRVAQRRQDSRSGSRATSSRRSETRSLGRRQVSAAAGAAAWSGTDPLYVRYHDEEWGVPVHDDRRLFEMLILEGAQAGLELDHDSPQAAGVPQGVRSIRREEDRALRRARRSARSCATPASSATG